MKNTRRGQRIEVKLSLEKSLFLKKNVKFNINLSNVACFCRDASEVVRCERNVNFSLVLVLKQINVYVYDTVMEYFWAFDRTSSILLMCSTDEGKSYVWSDMKASRHT